MEELLAALGHHTRVAIIEHLLGLDEEPPVAPRIAAQHEMREHLDFLRGTLSKHINTLLKARLLAVSPGDRADAPRYSVRQPDLLRQVVYAAARLDAGIAEDLAVLQRVGADMAAQRAEHWSRRQESQH